jgi:hypothetical protein
MDSIKVNPKRMSVKLQRLLMFMAAIMMALVTFTACIEDENGDENGGENGNGGGVAGKRIKSWLLTDETGSYTRTEYTYNSDGSIKQVDQYNSPSNRFQYGVYTNLSDGRFDKTDHFFVSTDMQFMTSKSQFSYDSNKKLQKMQTDTYINGSLSASQTIDYTFQNGKKTREVTDVGGGMVRVYEYDGQGRRTVTNETLNSVNWTRQYVRAYNTDGTLNKVTYPNNMVQNITITITCTWENGKSIMDFDDYIAW